MARRVLGLDVGSHSVKAALFKPSLRAVEIAQMRALGRRDPDAPLESLLPEWIASHDLEADLVVASLPGDRASTRTLTFPFRDRRRIGPAVPFELEAQVPFDLDEFLVDWQVLREEEGSTRVGATMARTEEVRARVQELAAAGLEPRVVEAEGLVLAHLARLFEIAGPRVLVDVGHRKTTLCLCEEGRARFARTLPVGGLAITRAIAQERGLPESGAEQVKIERGIFGPDGSEAGRQVVERLAREMIRTLESPEARVDSEAELVVLLCGGTAHLHRLPEFLSEQTGVRTERLVLPETELGSAATAAGDPLLFAPALALAARGCGGGGARMNLRRDALAPRMDLRKIGREFRSTIGLSLLALVLGLVVLGTEATLRARQAEAVEEQARQLYREAFPSRPAPRSVLAGMQQAVRAAQERADTLGVYRGNLSALDVLTELSARVPKELDVVFEELIIDRNVVQVKGHTPNFGSVDRLSAELAEFAPFSEITVGDITRDARRGGQNFSVRISLAAGGNES